MRCRDSHPRTLARPCPNNALAERGADCKENNWAIHRDLFTQLVYPESATPSFRKDAKFSEFA
jgi:hypothetical protein